ncbi:ABC-three component system protein [Paenibacillus solisilvae]|uniref:ABC-three component system protein n=1 Tax=Paenibacillus solisilvae TaxID=2486751 RepID=A0ABW0WBT2_9BACL
MDDNAAAINLNEYNIDEKIELNGLEIIKDSTIDEFKPYYAKLDRIYKQFEHEGINKRISVLRKLTSFYEKELLKNITNVERFFNIVTNVEDYILNSINLENFEEDIIEMCVRIITF